MESASGKLVLPIIPPIDGAAVASARARAKVMARPPGSLGRVEGLSVDVAGMRGGWDVSLGPVQVVVFAADHGVSAAGVSAYPAEVTALMLRAFAAGGATISAFARSVGADVTVVNTGVVGVGAIEGVVDARVGPGTRDLSVGPAMTPAEAEASVSVGLDLGARLVAEGAGVIVGGEMGIGNTTAASAIVAARTGRPARTVVGRGTGLDDVALARKVVIVERALEERPVGRDDGWAILVSVGGFEIGALAGLYLAAAATRTPIILDGAIGTAAALLADAIDPRVRPYLIAGHVSAEPSHTVALDALGLEPLLGLGMRLGEASGAVLAVPLVRAAVASLQDTMTLDEVMAAGSRA